MSWYLCLQVSAISAQQCTRFLKFFRTVLFKNYIILGLAFSPPYLFGLFTALTNLYSLPGSVYLQLVLHFTLDKMNFPHHHLYVLQIQSLPPFIQFGDQHSSPQ